MARHTGRAPDRFGGLGSGGDDGPLRRAVVPSAIHEWFHSATAARSSRVWHPPLTTALSSVSSGRLGEVTCCRAYVWIGGHCWPNPVAIAGMSASMLDRSVFVDARGLEDRAWAIETALRCWARDGDGGSDRGTGSLCVVADASGMDFKTTRRLQLAAEAGGSIGLMLRPPWEIGELSAARTRWLVTPSPSPDTDQRWTLELLRCKGVRPTMSEARRWAVTRCHATGDVRVVADAADRSVEASAAPARRQAV